MPLQQGITEIGFAHSTQLLYRSSQHEWLSGMIKIHNPQIRGMSCTVSKHKKTNMTVPSVNW
jgi:hypothetical protein